MLIIRLCEESVSLVITTITVFKVQISFLFILVFSLCKDFHLPETKIKKFTVFTFFFCERNYVCFCSPFPVFLVSRYYFENVYHEIA